MTDKADLDNYSFDVIYSEEDKEFVGTCKEFPGLSHLDKTKKKALNGIKKLVRDCLEIDKEDKKPKRIIRRKNVKT